MLRSSTGLIQTKMNVTRFLSLLYCRLTIRLSNHAVSKINTLSIIVTRSVVLSVSPFLLMILHYLLSARNKLRKFHCMFIEEKHHRLRILWASTNNTILDVIVSLVFLFVSFSLLHTSLPIINFCTLKVRPYITHVYYGCYYYFMVNNTP